MRAPGPHRGREPWDDEGIDWVELVAEARIQEAMEQGAFEDLPLKGRPLELEEFPFVPPGLRVPYKLLHDAGFAPDWIERDKEIREIEERLCQFMDSHLRWLEREAEARARAIASGTREDRAEADVRLATVREAQAEALREARLLLERRNGAVERFNHVVPSLLWQKAKWSVAERLDRFRKACDAAFPKAGEPEDA